MHQRLTLQWIRVGGPSPAGDIVVWEAVWPVPPSEVQRIRDLVWRQEFDEEPTCGLTPDVDGVRVKGTDGEVAFRYTRWDFERELTAWRSQK